MQVYKYLNSLKIPQYDHLGEVYRGISVNVLFPTAPKNKGVYGVPIPGTRNLCQDIRVLGPKFWQSD